MGTIQSPFWRKFSADEPFPFLSGGTSCDCSRPSGSQLVEIFLLFWEQQISDWWTSPALGLLGMATTPFCISFSISLSTRLHSWGLQCNPGGGDRCTGMDSNSNWYPCTVSNIQGFIVICAQFWQHTWTRPAIRYLSKAAILINLTLKHITVCLLFRKLTRKCGLTGLTCFWWGECGPGVLPVSYLIQSTWLEIGAGSVWLLALVLPITAPSQSAPGQKNVLDHPCRCQTVPSLEEGGLDYRTLCSMSC